MFLDGSAIIAILAGESDGRALAKRLDQATNVRTSPIAVFEAVAGLARIGNLPVADATAILDSFLGEVGAEVIAITPAIGLEALNAFARYGKHRHPAKLNMGDCFAYACARCLDAPLLFKGDDFPQTDIEAA